MLMHYTGELRLKRARQSSRETKASGIVRSAVLYVADVYHLAANVYHLVYCGILEL